MKLALSGLIVLGILGAIPLMSQESAVDTTGVASIQERKEAVLRYRLRVTGREGACTVAKGDALAADRAKLEMAGDCTTLMPRLGQARYWKDGAHGEVFFAGDDGNVIAEFYAADGVAYESVRPASPLMLLIAQ